jgi:tetratricopeptide (TPR) repeat protein
VDTGFRKRSCSINKVDRDGMACPHQSLPRLLARARRAHERGELDLAERLYAALLRRDPNHVDALHLLGLLNYQRGRLDAAHALISSAVALDRARVTTLSDLGLVLYGMARFEAALASYDAALAVAPHDPEALNGRGVALLHLGRAEAALETFARVLAIDPGHIDALGNQGNALLELNRPQAAIASYDGGLKLAPEHPRFLTNRAIALRRLDRPHEALAAVARARLADPRFAEARFVESLVRLSLGDFNAGWRGYESRWATAAFASHRRRFTPPLWLGEEPLAGKTILLHAEQGFGDTIQFVRYAPLVAQLGARVVLEVQSELVRLLSDLPGIAAVIAHGQSLPPFDLQCPLMSLPLALRTELATVPAPVPYIMPPRTGATAPGPAGERARIGLAWAGDPAHKNDANRSMRLAMLRPLFDLPQVRFVSLQQQMHAEDAELIRRFPDLLDAAAPFADFAETAATLAGLDAVMSVDTAVGHLAGAMGKPLFLVLPLGADFRWLRQRPDSPWYPTARLIRQREFNDWSSVIAELRCHMSDVGCQMSEVL